MNKNVFKKFAVATAMVALAAGGSAILKGQALRVPCTHLVAAHPYDVALDPWGNAIGTQPCVHIRALHPFDWVY